MKLTKQRLREIIKEEIRNLREAKQTQFQIPYREQKNVMKILRMGKSAILRGKYKEGVHYDHADLNDSWLYPHHANSI